MQNSKMFIFEDKYKPPALGSHDSMGLEIKAWDTRSIIIKGKKSFDSSNY